MWDGRKTTGWRWPRAVDRLAAARGRSGALVVALACRAARMSWRDEVDDERAVAWRRSRAGSARRFARRRPRGVRRARARARRCRRGTPGARGCPRGRSAAPCSGRRAGGARRARARARLARDELGEAGGLRRVGAAGAAPARAQLGRPAPARPRRCGSGRDRRRRIQRLAQRPGVARVAEESAGRASARRARRRASWAARPPAAARTAASPPARGRPRARVERRGARRRRDGGIVHHLDVARADGRGPRALDPVAQEALPRGALEASSRKTTRPGDCRPVGLLDERRAGSFTATLSPPRGAPAGPAPTARGGARARPGMVGRGEPLNLRRFAPRDAGPIAAGLAWLWYAALRRAGVLLLGDPGLPAPGLGSGDPAVAGGPAHPPVRGAGGLLGVPLALPATFVAGPGAAAVLVLVAAAFFRPPAPAPCARSRATRMSPRRARPSGCSPRWRSTTRCWPGCR